MYLVHRILKKPFFGRYQGKWRWPQGIPEETWESIQFNSRSGMPLKGYLGRSIVQPALGGVVFAHPMSLAAKGFWLKHGHAKLLREHGFHTLVFDFNGFGESKSTNFDYPGEVIAAGNYLHSKFPALPIAVCGASFGGGWALCALAEKQHPFKAAILESVFTDLPKFWSSFLMPSFILRASQIVYPRWESDLRPIRAAKCLIGQPKILLVYGEKDTTTPLEMGKRILIAAEKFADVDIWSVPGAGHTNAIHIAKAEYFKRIPSFLTHALGTESVNNSV